MAARDPNVTARNKSIQAMKEQLRSILPEALAESEKESEASINAFIGHRANDFLDLKHDVITTPEDYIHKWLQGMKSFGTPFKSEIQKLLENSKNKNFRKYVHIFLKRSFLKHYNELHKARPHVDDSEIWFGVNDAHYGLFVTPRWNGDEWENDNSEIRAVSFKYWTIGHVLKTGLCAPDDPEIYEFHSVNEYLNFFKAQVRLTKSSYQKAIASNYIEYVRESKRPENVPLLIPELRYDGSGRKHVYRLDFFTVNPFTMEKIGFEISPWSTHGKLTGKDKTLIKLNKEALTNFEREMKKIRDYFKKFKIPIFHFTDSDLVDIDKVWGEIEEHLDPGSPPLQLEMSMFSEYFGDL